MIRLLVHYSPCAVIARARRLIEAFEATSDWERWDIDSWDERADLERARTA